LRFRKVIPIINENDSVAVEELKFGDNDHLSAEVAILARADLLVILTGVKGLLDDRKRLISHVADIDAVVGLADCKTGVYSTGGMVSKLQAVRMAVQAGIPSVIGSGFEPGVVAAAVAEKPVGTYFSVNK
jgi:glutamate 5-kinase